MTDDSKWELTDLSREMNLHLVAETCDSELNSIPKAKYRNVVNMPQVILLSITTQVRIQESIWSMLKPLLKQNHTIIFNC